MNAVTWFEIPATNFDRAVAFYEGLLQVTLRREVFAGTMPNGIFPHDEPTGVGGAVAQVPYAKPGADGTLVYLNARSTAVLDAALANVERLGGQIIMPKTSLGSIGYMALIVDTEGNRIGLHLPAGM